MFHYVMPTVSNFDYEL